MILASGIIGLFEVRREQGKKRKAHRAFIAATGGKAAEESSFKKLGPRQWGAKAGVQKLGPDVVN